MKFKYSKFEGDQSLKHYIVHAITFARLNIYLRQREVVEKCDEITDEVKNGVGGD